MNKRVLSILTCVVLLVSVLTLTSFAQGKDALDLVVERGKLVVSSDLANYPWNYEDPETGEITGFVHELIKMFAKEIGVELEVMVYDFAGNIPALTSGKVDMIASTLSRTMPRALKILYTEPYMMAPLVGYALKGKYKDVSELDKEGTIIFAAAGSMQVDVVKVVFPNAECVELPTTAEGVAAILSGRGNAFIEDRPKAQAIVQANPGLEIIPGYPGGYKAVDSFAFAVRYDSPKLCNVFNMFLRIIKLDGRYNELHQKWLESDWAPVTLEMSL
jgi:ABC-type amino acid transport substrate-binding protein